MMQDVKHSSMEGQMLVIGTNGQVKATDKRSSNSASRDGAYVIGTPVIVSQRIILFAYTILIYFASIDLQVLVYIRLYGDIAT